MLPLRKIVCPTDFSEPSREAVRVAAEPASHFEAEMLLLHVVVPSSVVPPAMEVPPVNLPLTEQELEASARQSLEETAGRLQAQGLRAEFRVLQGNAAEEIVQAAEQEKAELIAIATRGRTGLDRFIFGSLAEKVIRLARCPVLTIGGRPSPRVGEEPSPEGEESKTTEEKSEKRKAYEERLEAQLKQWGAKIDELKAKAETSLAELKNKYEKQIEELRVRQEGGRQKVLELRRSGEEAWEGLRGGVEKSLDDLKEAFDRAISKFKEKKAETTERVSKKREAYRQKAEDQLKEWGAQIDVLKGKAQKSKAEVKMRYLEQVEELRKKQETVRGKLQEFRKSGDEAWTDLRDGIDGALDDLKQALKRAVSRFKEK
jgi:nucleotide-binding universal stress UspA family protein